MNLTQRREARVRLGFIDHVAECMSDVCPQYCRYANTDLLVRVGRDLRLAIETIEVMEADPGITRLEHWHNGGGI